MELNEAKKLLSACVRDELRDHAFGDREIYWMKGDVEIATGYSGSEHVVSVHPEGPSMIDCKKPTFEFKGRDALELIRCGNKGTYERNDETGPADYKDGHVMPGLTLDGVREEITRHPHPWD